MRASLRSDPSRPRRDRNRHRRRPVRRAKEPRRLASPAPVGIPSGSSAFGVEIVFRAAVPRDGSPAGAAANTPAIAHKYNAVTKVSEANRPQMSVATMAARRPAGPFPVSDRAKTPARINRCTGQALAKWSAPQFGVLVLTAGFTVAPRSKQAYNSSSDIPSGPVLLRADRQ